MSAEEQKEFAQLQNEIEVYKAKLRSEFGYRPWTESSGIGGQTVTDCRLDTVRHRHSFTTITFVQLLKYVIN